MAERVTLLTLAKDLGLSRATVSNAYNRPDQLSAATRARVLARAQELGFAAPDPRGASLRRGRTGSVGVLLDQGVSYAFSDPTAVLDLDGLATEVQQDGLGLLLHSGTRSRTDAAVIASAAVDAWVLRALPQDEPAVAAVIAQQRPVVVIDQPRTARVPLVGVDDAQGARLAVGHLLELGHRRIGVLAVPLRPDGYQGMADAKREQFATYDVMRIRLAAVRGAVADAGLPEEAVRVVECATNDVDTGALGTYELLELEDRPSAVLAMSDQLAIGALRAAAEMGVRVPRDLSVVGYDDAPAASTSHPPLTTVAQPLGERGRVAGALVRAALAGEEITEPELLPVSLVVRESTAPPQG